MKTTDSIINNTEKYRKTIKGIVTNMYNHQKVRSKNKGRDMGYSLEYLQNRCNNNKKFLSLYENWLKNTNRWNKPSIDRIDCFLGYTPDNIQVMTAMENKIKGDKEKEKLWGKEIVQYDIYGNKIKEYKSIKQAVKETGCWQGLISSCLLGKRNHTGGYIRKYKLYENPDLLSPIS